MNIQYIKLGLLATLFVGGTALFTSCADDLDVGTQFDKEMYNGVYENMHIYVMENLIKYPTLSNFMGKLIKPQ